MQGGSNTHTGEAVEEPCCERAAAGEVHGLHCREGDSSGRYGVVDTHAVAEADFLKMGRCYAEAVKHCQREVRASQGENPELTAGGAEVGHCCRGHSLLTECHFFCVLEKASGEERRECKRSAVSDGGEEYPPVEPRLACDAAPPSAHSLDSDQVWDRRKVREHFHQQLWWESIGQGAPLLLAPSLHSSRAPWAVLPSQGDDLHIFLPFVAH